MNLSLSDEQEFLREAARGALSRFKTLEAAREALDGQGELPDMWPTACEAGWPGLLIDEEHGGAGLDAFDAMLVLGECGRVIAAIPLLGHLPASAILNDSPNAAEFLPALASGERRAAYLPCCPPDQTASGQWSTDPASGLERSALPTRRQARRGRPRGAQRQLRVRPGRAGRERARRRGDARRKPRRGRRAERRSRRGDHAGQAL